MIHPEIYLGSRFTDKYIPPIILEEYAISDTIQLWIKYFISLGIQLQKEDNVFEYAISVKYNGKGFYELRFFLEKEEVEGGWVVKQNIPTHIQSEIEEIIITDDKNFIDCDTWTGEIYVSFDFEEYYMNYIRSERIGKLINKIKNNIVKVD